MTSAIGGVSLWLGFPSWNLWPLAVVAPALLSLATHRQSARRAAALGLVFGLTFMVPLLSWSGIFVGRVPWLALSLSLSLSQALFYAALGAAIAAVSRLPGSPWWAALLWVSAEAARSRWPFGGLPWGRLGFSQADSPLAQLAALGGVPLSSFAVAATGTLLAHAVVQRREPRPEPDTGLWPRGGRSLLWAALPWLLTVPPWAPTVLVEEPDADGGTVDIAVIQGNVPRVGLDFNAQRRAVLDNHVGATLDLAADVAAGRERSPQLVIWPENSSDIDPLTNHDAAERIDLAARAIGVPILIGAVLEGPGQGLTNARIVWDPVTGPGDQYAKRHPVPFGEYMPARSFFRLFSDEVDLLRRDFVAGQEPGLLEVAGVPVGDVICSEVAYDGLVGDVVDQGAELLVVQTNNATFGYTDESPQQLAMSRLRAIEHDRTVIVSATSGLSAVIDSNGVVTEQSGLFAPWTFNETVNLHRGSTLATRLGMLPEAAMSLLGLAAWGQPPGSPSAAAASRSLQPPPRRHPPPFPSTHPPLMRSPTDERPGSGHDVRPAVHRGGVGLFLGDARLLCRARLRRPPTQPRTRPSGAAGALTCGSRSSGRRCGTRFPCTRTGSVGGDWGGPGARRRHGDVSPQVCLEHPGARVDAAGRTAAGQCPGPTRSGDGPRALGQHVRVRHRGPSDRGDGLPGDRSTCPRHAPHRALRHRTRGRQSGLDRLLLVRRGGPADRRAAVGLADRPRVRRDRLLRGVPGQRHVQRIVPGTAPSGASIDR